jgi:hypothetical protein
MGDRSQGAQQARLIVVDPRFTLGVRGRLLRADPHRYRHRVPGRRDQLAAENDRIQHEYVKNYTDFSFIVREDFQFANGLFRLRRGKAQLRQGKLGLRTRRTAS